MESKMKDKLAVVGAIVLFIGLAVQFIKLVWAPYVYLVVACCVSGSGLLVCLRTAGFRLIGKEYHYPSFAPSAAFGSYVAGVDRGNHVTVETERMDCLPDGGRGIGTLHGIPYSAGRSKGELV